MKTIEEKARAYDEALEKAKKLYEKGTITESIGYIFPELVESEDEKIRKSIIENLKGNMYRADGDYDLLNKQIAWLEKQQSVEEIIERCKKSWYNEGKIAGMAEGLSDDEKYRQGWHDALENKGEQNHAWSEDDERIRKTSISFLKHYADKGYENAVECIDWLESIKERCTWKPSEEQIQCLHDAIEHYHTNGYPASKLNELYEQMSKIYKL